MAGDVLDFDTALAVVRASTLFTTHTPVPAGIDRFPRDMVERYFSDDTPLVPGDSGAALRRRS
jgi:starch phosphorylase